MHILHYPLDLEYSVEYHVAVDGIHINACVVYAVTFDSCQL